MFWLRTPIRRIGGKEDLGLINHDSIKSSYCLKTTRSEITIVGRAIGYFLKLCVVGHESRVDKLVSLGA